MNLIWIVLAFFTLSQYETRAESEWPSSEQQRQVRQFLNKWKMLEEATQDSLAFHWETIGGRQSRCNTASGTLEEIKVSERCTEKGAGHVLPAVESLKLAEAKAGRFIGCHGQRGLYYASDPIVSRMYGYVQKGESVTYNCWRLIVSDLKKGTRFLRVPADLEAERELAKILGREGCAKKIFEVIDHDRKATAEDIKCAAFKRQLFRDLRVGGIRYEWEFPGAIPSLCGTKRYDRHAIVLTDPELLQGSRVYTKYGGPSSSREASTVSERRAIQDIFNATTYVTKPDQVIEPNWFDEKVRQGLEIAPGKKGYVPTKGRLQPETASWMRENLSNCQPSSPFAPVNAVDPPGRTTESRDALR